MEAARAPAWQLQPQETPKGAAYRPPPEQPVDQMCKISDELFGIKAGTALYTWDRFSVDWYLLRKFKDPQFTIQCLSDGWLCAYWTRPRSTRWDRFHLLLVNPSKPQLGAVTGPAQQVTRAVADFALLAANRAVCLLKNKEIKLWDPGTPYDADSLVDIGQELSTITNFGYCPLIMAHSLSGIPTVDRPTGRSSTKRKGGNKEQVISAGAGLWSLLMPRPQQRAYSSSSTGRMPLKG